jgi:hypothetical protein
MRFSSIVLNMAALLAVHVLAGPTGDVAEMDNIEKRGCGTGNWCCTVANPSQYCVKYCAAGSIYIDCGASYVRISPTTHVTRNGGLRSDKLQCPSNGQCQCKCHY